MPPLGGGIQLVVGLGNPGPRYEDTRHNAGFRVVDRVAEALCARWRPGTGPWLEARGRRSGCSFLMQKPLTYMNLSGDAVAPLWHAHRLPLERILIVCDDLDLPLGCIRLRKSGGSGGQKGLRSILAALDTEDVPRLRLGIGPRVGDAADFVLAPFAGDQRETADEMTMRAADLILELPGSDLDGLMNRYNR